MTSPGPSPRRLGGAHAEAASDHAHWRHRTSLPFITCIGLQKVHAAGNLD
jgi:hypothetical protein